MFSRVLMKLEDNTSRKGSFTVTLNFIYFFFQEESWSTLKPVKHLQCKDTLVLSAF